LSQLRETYGRRLVVNTTRYEGSGADEKLLKLSADTGGTLLTADYNLAQVAKVQDLKVLNLSELVIALRPEVQPGDGLQIKIVREGKEAEQGVGYLEDGTMVVVEEARRQIGERLAVTVTGALQTPTGRMVFARWDGATTAGRGELGAANPVDGRLSAATYGASGGEGPSNSERTGGNTSRGGANANGGAASSSVARGERGGGRAGGGKPVSSREQEPPRPS
jgi:hypothetical protein